MHDLFKQAVKLHGAVEARTGAFTQGDLASPCKDMKADVVHCFNKHGKEVCLFMPGTSAKPRAFDPPREWVPSLRKRLRVVLRKEDL